MQHPPEDTWTRAHDLALVYLALAYGTDNELSDAELSAITLALSDWREDNNLEASQEVVLEVLAIYLDDEANISREVRRAIGSLGKILSPDQRRHALEDIIRIAEADGVMLLSERELITTIAGEWELKAVGEQLLEQTTAETAARPRWSLLHDISLMYIVVAHSTDNELSDDEIATMIERLREWQPELDEQEARAVLREVLQVYAGQPEAEALRASVTSIRDRLPVVQRLAVLNDLTHIAESDGDLNEEEGAMLSMLSQAWGLNVRLNGHAEV